MQVTRRQYLQLAAALSVGGADLGRRAAACDEPRLIIRGDHPLNAETPVDLLTDRITPNRLFFVRSHFGPPAVSLHDWTVRVGGLVEKPNRWSLEYLNKFEHAELTAVLQCAGNGRALFDPAPPGVQWERGAVGQATWRGVRLCDVLAESGVRDNARHVHIYGGDPPPHPKTPAFLRSLPVERALDPSTLLVTEMNGEPLPIVNGGPLRLIVPGWTGNHWIKWVRVIAPSEEEAPGFYQRTGYRIPRSPVAPGTDVKPEDTVPVTWMNVKSLIVSPGCEEKRKSGPTEIRGVAWTGQGHVTAVDVSIDGDAWKPARLLDSALEYEWRRWAFDWNAPQGQHTLRARATDSNGAVQPDRGAWNKSGYLWNGIDQVRMAVS